MSNFSVLRRDLRAEGRGSLRRPFFFTVSEWRIPTIGAIYHKPFAMAKFTPYRGRVPILFANNTRCGITSMLRGPFTFPLHLRIYTEISNRAVNMLTDVRMPLCEISPWYPEPLYPVRVNSRSVGNCLLPLDNLLSNFCNRAVQERRGCIDLQPGPINISGKSQRSAPHAKRDVCANWPISNSTVSSSGPNHHPKGCTFISKPLSGKLQVHVFPVTFKNSRYMGPVYLFPTQ